MWDVQVVYGAALSAVLAAVLIAATRAAAPSS